jgi:hypothetical protein
VPNVTRPVVGTVTCTSKLGTTSDGRDAVIVGAVNAEKKTGNENKNKSTGGKNGF